MSVLHFFVPGKVNGAQRHRAQLRGGHIHMHRTNKEISNSQAVRDCFVQAYPDFALWEGPVAVMIEARVMPPKSAWPGKECLVKPDWDNIGKLVCDALNRVAYRDDSQIDSGTVRKRYCEPGEVEGLQVQLSLQEAFKKPTRARSKEGSHRG